MGQSDNGWIGCKFMGARCNSADKKNSKGSKINTNLKIYVSKTVSKKEVRKTLTCWYCC